MGFNGGYGGIAYVSEHFNHTLTGNDFEDISNVESLIDMIGKENSQISMREVSGVKIDAISAVVPKNIISNSDPKLAGIFNDKELRRFENDRNN